MGRHNADKSGRHAQKGGWRGFVLVAMFLALLTIAVLVGIWTS